MTALRSSRFFFPENVPMNDFTAQQNAAAGAASIRPRRLLALVSAIACLSMASMAQAGASETAMTKLIRGLMQSGALTRDVGEALLAQAQAEAQAQQQNAAAPVAAAPAAGTVQTQPGDVRVTYLSPKAREQIRNEVKTEVMAQAKAEGWAAPNETPEWTKRVRVEADLRVRNESRFFSGNNSNIEIDWGKINGGSGYDINPNTNLALPPLLNTREDRNNLWRLRARVGVLADISERTKAGVRLATGSDDNPVSTNQTLGGGLSKKSVWLDQGWVSHQPTDWVKITAGRFGNPFMSTDTLFSNDLNFDGVAAQFEHATWSGSGGSLFGTLGYIPLEYSADNFPGTSQDKMESKNKWLLGAQVGANWKINDTNQLRGALAYYDFHNISGRLSEPCELYAGEDHCSTDWARPDFMQKGNTLMLLRNIALDPLDPANTRMPQYVGLASEFELIDLNLRWDTTVLHGLGLRLDFNYIHNLAFDENDLWKRGAGGIVNNFAGSGGTSRPDFESGGDAYMLQALLGNVNLKARGDWNVLFGYKYIEPDALPDGYNDSTFHLGGTNAKGYYVGGSYAFDKNTWVSGRWFATKEVYGAPLSIDILQLELNTRF